MFKDVLFPGKFGNYYISSKQVLSIDITSFAVYGMLVLFRGGGIQVQKTVSVFLKEFSDQEIIGAIKKITTTIGFYQEITTSLSSSVIVFKELRLPFVGREQLDMIVAYEIEPLLPFSVEQAVVDFMVTHEDTKNNVSTILVAAALKEDLDKQLDIFQKAGVTLQVMTVDMFALYRLYRNGIYKEKFIKQKSKNLLKKKSSATNENSFMPHQINDVDMFVDVGFDVVRVLYIQNGILKAVRMIPYGIIDIVQSVSNETELSEYEIAQQIVWQKSEHDYQKNVEQGLKKIFNEIMKSLASFEKIIAIDYQKPKKIIFSGLGCDLSQFMTLAQSFFDIMVEKINILEISKTLHVKITAKEFVNIEHIPVLAIALFDKYDEDVNLLKSHAQKRDAVLFYKQIIAIMLCTFVCIGGIFWNSNLELQKWDRAYIASKKDLVMTIQKKMNIDVRNERSVKDMVQKAEHTLKKEHKRWFSFSKQIEQSYLEYLQDLSVQIDRESIGLDISKLVLDPDMVTMTAKVKDFEALEVFEEELSELKLLTLVDKPKGISFKIQLKIKDRESSDGS